MGRGVEVAQLGKAPACVADMGASCSQHRRRVIFHLLEDAEKRDEEVEAIHHQADAHQTDERDLVIAQCIADATLETVDSVG